MKNDTLLQIRVPGELLERVRAAYGARSVSRVVRETLERNLLALRIGGGVAATVNNTNNRKNYLGIVITNPHN